MAANLPTHPSLPARPPPSSYAAPPVHHNGAAGARPFAGFTPRSVSAQIAPPVTAAPSVYPQANVSTAPSPYASSGTYYDNSYAAYGTATPTAAYPANPPMSRGYGAGSYDAEEEARIAEWSNAYAQDANGKKGANAAGAAGANRPEAASTPDSEAGTKTGKQKTVVREAGGKSWEDPSLLEWDPMHPRLFIGNLAGEVTDDSLLKAFSKYPSVSKARVVRDKRTTKSKSYGFVSFADTDDYFKAAKEMQGKYIGSHPVLIKRANTTVKAVTKKDEKHKHGKKNLNKQNQNISGSGAAVHPAAAAINPTPARPAGVQKKKGKQAAPRFLG